MTRFKIVADNYVTFEDDVLKLKIEKVAPKDLPIESRFLLTKYNSKGSDDESMMTKLRKQANLGGDDD